MNCASVFLLLTDEYIAQSWFLLEIRLAFGRNGCALRHCRRVPSPGEARQRRKEGKALLPVVRKLASTRAALCDVFVDLNLSFGLRVSAAQQS